MVALHIIVSRCRHEKDVREKVTYSVQDPHWGWTIGAGIYIHEYSTESTYLLITTVVTLIATILIGLFLVISLRIMFQNHFTKL